MHYITCIEDARALRRRTKHVNFSINSETTPDLAAAIWQVLRERLSKSLQSLEISLYAEDPKANYLPDCIGEFAELRHLSIYTGESVDAQALPLSISRLSQLISFDMSINAPVLGMPMPDLSASVQSLQSLFVRLPNAGNLPAWISQCHLLQKLEWYDSNASELPDIFDHLQHLEQLNISSSSIQSLPPSLFRLQKLHTLTLSESQLSSAPAALWQMPRLIEFSANNSQISRVGEGLTAEIMRKSVLYSINLSNNPIGWISQHLWDLPNGSWLNIDIPTGSLPLIDWWLNEENLYMCGYNPQERIKHYWTLSATSDNANYSPNFLRKSEKAWTQISCNVPESAEWSLASRAVWMGCGEKRWSKEERNELLRFVWAQERGENASLPLPSLLRAYTLSCDEHLRALLDKEIRRLYQPAWEKKPLSKSSRLALIGDFFAPSKELQTHIKPYFAAVQSKISPNCSHVLLSMNAKSSEIDALLANPQLLPILWQETQKHLYQQGHFHLLQTETPDTAQLESLLLSEDIDNINLGLTLLSSGGVPAQLREALGAILARAENDMGTFNPVATQAKALISAFFGSDLACQIPKLIAIYYSEDNWKLAKKACKKGQLNFENLLQSLDAIKSNYIEFYWREQQRHPEELRETLRKFLQKNGGKLNLTQAKYAGKILKTIPELHTIDCSDSWFYTIPSAILLPQIRHLNFSTVGLPRISKRILALENLQTIDLSSSYYLEKFPHILAELPNLREILCAEAIFASNLHEKLQNKEPITDKDIDLRLFDISQLPDKIIRRR